MAYQYQRLPKDEDCVRLLYLRPSSDFCSPLEAFLVEDSTNTEFDALSYTWGSQPKSAYTKSIFLEEGTLLISDTLWHALCCLRWKTSRIRCIWVDAICINQEDFTEKAEQVRRMRSIYALAQQVFVHLGNEQDNSAIIPKFIDSQMKTPLSYQGTTEERIALFALFLRPWFTRAWVIQEFVLSKACTVILGRDKIPFEHLIQVVRLNVLQQNYQRGPLKKPKAFARAKARSQETLDLSDWRDRYRENGDLPRMIDLLERDFPSNRQASIARDFLFSLLGLACDGDIVAFSPDYSEQTHLVIRRYANALVLQGYFPRLIRHAGNTNDQSVFPSWCPNWCQPNASRQLQYPLSDVTFLYIQSLKTGLAIKDCDPQRTKVHIQTYQEKWRFQRPQNFIRTMRMDLLQDMFRHRDIISNDGSAELIRSTTIDRLSSNRGKSGDKEEATSPMGRIREWCLENMSNMGHHNPVMEVLSVAGYQLDTIDVVLPEFKDVTAQFVLQTYHSELKFSRSSPWPEVTSWETIGTLMVLKTSQSDFFVKEIWSTGRDKKGKYLESHEMDEGVLAMCFGGLPSNLPQNLDLNLDLETDHDYMTLGSISDQAHPKLSKTTSFFDLMLQQVVRAIEHDFIAAELRSHIKRLAATMTFCRCRSGTIVCVPKGAKENDIICTLDGAENVVILRSSERRRQAHRVIGTCWSSSFSSNLDLVFRRFTGITGSDRWREICRHAQFETFSLY